MLNLEALLRTPYVDPERGFGISPDGRKIAFSWNPSGRWEIYVMPLDCSIPPQPLTSGPGSKFAPSWSPDGQQLTYVQDLDGGERYDIYCHSFSTGEQVNLTPDTPDAIQPNLSWSPDGRWIAFASDRSGRFDTYLMRASGGPARPLLSLPYPDWQMRWSPDGRWLAVVAETKGQDYGTFLVPTNETGAPIPIADKAGPVCAKEACWSPDGCSVAFASDIHGRFEIGIYELAAGQITWVTHGPGDKESPAWSPDGRQLAYIISQGPLTQVALQDLGQASPTLFQIAPGVHYRPCFSPKGGHLFLVFENPGHPADLWSLCLRNHSFQQLTHSLPADLQPVPFVLPSQVSYPSLDGQMVPALLYRPPAAHRLSPAVILIHGGPSWLSQVIWSPPVQHMVSRGWVVLAPNYRGSTGYGRDWQLASRFDLGGVDAQDLVAGADYLIREKLADLQHIALTGRSWGGYLTMTCLTQFPDRWAAGSAVAPFLNWFTGHANSRPDLQHWDLENMGHPERDRDLYQKRSPYFFLDRIRAPVQLICGAHDPRCPASESTQAFEQMVAQGQSCDLLLIPDEGHSFLKIENVLEAEDRRMSFLAGVLESETCLHQ